MQSYVSYSSDCFDYLQNFIIAMYIVVHVNKYMYNRTASNGKTYKQICENTIYCVCSLKIASFCALP